jgi:hypothetical protein
MARPMLKSLGCRIRTGFTSTISICIEEEYAIKRDRGQNSGDN